MELELRYVIIWCFLNFHDILLSFPINSNSLSHTPLIMISISVHPIIVRIWFCMFRCYGWLTLSQGLSPFSVDFPALPFSPYANPAITTPLDRLSPPPWIHRSPPRGCFPQSSKLLLLSCKRANKSINNIIAVSFQKLDDVISTMNRLTHTNRSLQVWQGEYM